MQFPFAFLFSLIALVSADSATCGQTQYNSDAVGNASDAACTFVQKNSTAGKSTYPHQYKNFENFKLKGLTGPFYEYPILSSGQVYSGSAPGPDRVIITKDCKQAGVITHTGANGNSFVSCNVKVDSAAPVLVAHPIGLTVSVIVAYSLIA